MIGRVDSGPGHCLPGVVALHRGRGAYVRYCPAKRAATGRRWHTGARSRLRSRLLLLTAFRGQLPLTAQSGGMSLIVAPLLLQSCGFFYCKDVR